MPISIGVSGAQKLMQSGSAVGVGGVWKPIQQIWIGVGGVWKSAYVSGYSVNVPITSLTSFASGDNITVSMLGNGNTAYDRGNGTFSFGTWTNDPVPANWDVRLVVNSGPTPAGAATGTWLNMGSNRTWQWNSVGASNVTFQIGPAGSGTVTASATVTMTRT